MGCPKCGRVNSPEASRCECGHEFFDQKEVVSRLVDQLIPPLGWRWIVRLTPAILVYKYPGPWAEAVFVGLIALGIIEGIFWVVSWWTKRRT